MNGPTPHLTKAQRRRVPPTVPPCPQSGKTSQSQSRELASGAQTPNENLVVSHLGWPCQSRAWGQARERPLSSLWPASRAACDPWKESGDVSDSGSSTTSGHWSGSSGVSTPSPPHPQASPKYLGDAFGSPQTDNGFETDPDAFLLDEPAPRKRKVQSMV